MRVTSFLGITLVSAFSLVGCDSCSPKGKSPVSSQAGSDGSLPATSTNPSQMAASGSQTGETGPSPDISTAPVDSAMGGSETTGTAAAIGTSTGTSSSPQDSAVAAKGELQMTDIKLGKGPEAVDGKKITVHYTGTLENGTKFDSSRDRGTPFPFILGSGMVIAGWEKGLVGMKEGGVRKLVIPPHLAYGEKSVGGGVIPPNSTLVFEIELLKVE